MGVLFASTASDVRGGVSDAIHKVINGIPNVVEAIIVLLVGVIVGFVAKAIVVSAAKGLRKLRLQPWAEKARLNKVFTDRVDLAELLGDLVKWFFIVVFLLQALAILHLQEVTNIVNHLLAYVPQVLAAVAIVFVGGIVADLVSRIVREAAKVLGAGTASLLSGLARWSIWAVVIFTALAQLGINTTFLDRLFTAIVVMIALAGGLSFGLGGRDLAREALESTRKSLVAKK